MRLGRTFIIILVVLLVVLLGLLAFMNFSGGLNFTSTNDEPTETVEQQPQVNTTDVLFLTRPLTRGDVITADALGRIPYPADLLYIGVYTVEREDEVLGMKVKYNLEQGMYLTNRMLTEELMGSEKSLEIEPGKVAVPVPITRFTSLGYALEPGDHVDVITTMMYVDLDPSFQTALPNQSGVVLSPSQNFVLPSGVTDQYGQSTSYSIAGSTEEIAAPLDNLVAQIVSLGGGSILGRAEYDAALQQPMYVLPSEPIQRPRILSQMTIQNAMVLHVGNTDPDADNSVYVDPKIPAATVEEGQEPQPATLLMVPDIVTLVVSPQEAVALNYMVYAEAEIMLALRSAYDNNAAPVYTDAVTLDYLMNIYNIPVPNKLDYGLQPRVDELTAPVLDNDQNVVILP